MTMVVTSLKWRPKQDALGLKVSQHWLATSSWWKMTLSLFPTVGFYGVSANLNLWGSSEVCRKVPGQVQRRFGKGSGFQNVSGMNLASNILLSLLGISIWAYFPWNLRMNERTPFRVTRDVHLFPHLVLVSEVLLFRLWLFLKVKKHWIIPSFWAPLD